MKLNNTYFLLRHGETSYQITHKGFIYPFPEPKPILLTEKGKGQILSAAEKLKKEKIDFIFASPYSRTRQTAGIVGKELGLKVSFDKRLRELNLGIFKGKKTKDYYAYFSSLKQRFSKRPSQGENLREVQKRMFDFLKEIDRKYKGKKVLIVSHGDPLLVLEGAIRGLTEDEILDEKVCSKIDLGELRKFSSN